jgi:class 3 adenylate cyclase
VAARVTAVAEGGEVLVGDALRELVADQEFTFEDRGMHALRGIREPVRVWAVVEAQF